MMIALKLRVNYSSYSNSFHFWLDSCSRHPRCWFPDFWEEMAAFRALVFEEKHHHSSLLDVLELRWWFHWLTWIAAARCWLCLASRQLGTPDPAHEKLLGTEGGPLKMKTQLMQCAFQCFSLAVPFSLRILPGFLRATILSVKLLPVTHRWI